METIARWMTKHNRRKLERDLERTSPADVAELLMAARLCVRHRRWWYVGFVGEPIVLG